MFGKLHLLQAWDWWLCATAGRDAVPGKDPGRAGYGHDAVQSHCNVHIPPSLQPGGQLHLRVLSPRSPFFPLSPSAGFHPSAALMHPSILTLQGPSVPVPPRGLRHKRIPLGRKTRLTEVRRTQCHSSYRMATIARETELSTALHRASPSGNFI